MIQYRRVQHPMTIADRAFVVRCLTELNGKLPELGEPFDAFVELLTQDPSTEILVAESDGVSVGVVTSNRFAMPRYAGFGYEIQEIVVAEEHRGRGFGKAMLEGFVARYAADERTRKVVVRTNDPRSQALYARTYGESDLKSFQKFVHKI